MFALRVFCFYAGFIGLFLFCASAKSESVDIAYSDPVKPFLYVEDGALKGIDAAIMNAVMNELGFRVNYVYKPWAKALEAAKTGKLDGLLSVYCSQPAEELMITRERTYQTKVSVFALKENNYTVDDLYHGDTQKSVSVVYGNFHNRLLSKYTNITKTELPDIITQGFRLLKGEVDFSVSEESWFLFQMASRNAVDKVTVIDVLDTPDVCLGFSKKAFEDKPYIMRDINITLWKLKENGYIQGLFEQYGVNKQ